jgi:Fe-S cluster biogenesis protein NfuA
MDVSQVKILAEPQKEPNKCKFVLDKPYVEGGSFTFSNKNETLGSALAEALLNVKNVTEVFIAATSILVTKEGNEDWRITGREVGQAIRAALSSGKELISPELKSKLPPADEIRKTVNTLLEKEINPAVAAHNGYIELLDVKNNDIFIKMGGGCQGCASSTATLKLGVEQALRKQIPLLGSIYDTTDHAAGANPYYTAGH